MAKYAGKIGFVETIETRPGVWEEKVVAEPEYYGDILRQSRMWQGSENLNDDLNVSNQISIVADPYAFHHFHSMRYIYWFGTRWKISNVEVKFPRLILTLGGVYNGQQTGTA